MTRAPSTRHELAMDGYRIGLPVSSADAADVAELATYCQARGAALIPASYIGGQIDQGQTRNIAFRVRPKSTSRARRWTMAIATTGDSDESCPLVITVDVSTSRSVTYVGSVSGGYDTAGGRLQALTFVQPLDAAPTAVQQITVRVVNASSAQNPRDVTLWWLSCHELDRLDLAPGDQGFVDLPTLSPGEILYDAAAGQSYPAIAAAATGGLDARRVGLMHRAYFAEAPASTTSTSAVTLFSQPIVPARVAYDAALTTVTVDILARVTGGTGTVAIEAGAESDSASVTSTSLTWHTLTVGMPAEDLTEPDGRPGGAWTTLLARMTAPSGQTIEVASVSAYRNVEAGAIT